MEGIALLREARTILLIDWPSRDVPDSLARAGLRVVSSDGPDVYNYYETDGDEVRVRRADGPPAQVDIIYAFRPLDELPEIVNQAHSLGARAVWLERVAPPDVGYARETVESEGLTYIDAPSIADAARTRGG